MEGTIHIKNKQEQEYWIDGALVDKVTTSAYSFDRYGREAYVHYKSGEVETIPGVVVIEVLGTYTLEAKPLPTTEEEKAAPDRWWPDNVDVTPVNVIIGYIEKTRRNFGYGVRLSKIFEANDIKTVGDLLRIGRRDFRKYRSVGGGCITRFERHFKRAIKRDIESRKSIFDTQTESGIARRATLKNWNYGKENLHLGQDGGESPEPSNDREIQ